jgi:hypothetical protein
LQNRHAQWQHMLPYNIHVIVQVVQAYNIRVIVQVIQAAIEQPAAAKTAVGQTSETQPQSKELGRGPSEIVSAF